MPLLQEKLKAPPLPLSVVARPRLNDFFALNERIRLLVVQAPSGYGKTDENFRSALRRRSKSLTIKPHESFFIDGLQTT